MNDVSFCVRLSVMHSKKTSGPNVFFVFPSAEGWLKVFAMKHGVVGIKGVKSGLYLCMSGEGLTYGAVCSQNTSWINDKLSSVNIKFRADGMKYLFRRSSQTTACWRRTWRRTTTPPTPLCRTQASIWLFPTKGSWERGTVWDATSPAPTSYLGGHRD